MNPYEVLMLPPDGSFTGEQLQKNYMRLMTQLRPDVCGRPLHETRGVKKMLMRAYFQLAHGGYSAAQKKADERTEKTLQNLLFCMGDWLFRVAPQIAKPVLGGMAAMSGILKEYREILS